MFNNEMKEFMKKIPIDDLQLGIGDVAEATGVSQSQLRYWERKGYIQSLETTNRGNHKFTYKTVMQVKQIQLFMDDGYTLSSAVARARKRGAYMDLLRSFFEQRFEGMTAEDGAKIDLGPFDPEPTKHLVAYCQDQQWRFRLDSVE